MKSLVIYDSLYGNTEKVAEAIGKGIKADVVHVSKVKADNLRDYELIVFGTPTHGGRPSQKMQEFLNKIGRKELEGVGVAAYDTRIAGKDIGVGLKIVTGILGYAAGRVEKTLEAKGGRSVGVEGFVVEGKEGPLKKGELERAREWGVKITLQ